MADNTVEQVSESVSALYKVLEKTEQHCESKNERSSVKPLFDDDYGMILLINLHKIPQIKSDTWQQVKIHLPNCPLGESPTVCLIVKDLERKRHADSDLTVQHYGDFLKKKNVNNITEVMPLNVLRTSYKPYEAKRNLCQTFDKFLSDRKIQAYLPKLLGKSFIVAKKFPTPVYLSRNAKKDIGRGMNTVNLMLVKGQATYKLCVGKSNLGVDKTVENVNATLQQLAVKLPGGWANVKSVYLKSDKTLAIPVYIATNSSVDVILSQKEKPELKVQPEELSTLYNKKVIVHPDGELTLVKDDTVDSDFDNDE